MQQPVYTVSQVNTYIQSLMDSDRFLSGLCIRGEISNYKVYPSGHHYFSLKDSEGAIRCVMFKTSAMRLRFRPENGMRVLALGRVSVFPRDGAYQLYCTGLMADGIGDLHVAFEQQKARLAAKGYFDPAHKKKLPRFPETIVIVTSSAGAAVQDMLRVLGKRYPLAKVRLLPVRVQGTEAAGEIAAAIDYANLYHLGDLIITGRGGGSMEDLWAFNEELVAQAIYRSEIPVISAVGHEPDVTIADYVADLRAATPSNGAELAVPDGEELKKRLKMLETSMGASMAKQLHLAGSRFNALASARVFTRPESILENRRLYLDTLHRRLYAAADSRVQAEETRFARLTAALDAMSPLRVLGRGYAIARDTEGKVVRSVRHLEKDKPVTVLLRDGSFTATVTDVEIKEEAYGRKEEGTLL